MTYEKATEAFEEAIEAISRDKNPELWHLLRGLNAFCMAVRRDIDDLKRRHETTQEDVAKVSSKVTTAQDNLNDILKGLE